MFRATRALLAPGVVKKTTGLVGVPVVSNAREVLVSLYEKTLEDVKVGSGRDTQCVRRPVVWGCACALRPVLYALRVWDFSPGGVETEGGVTQHGPRLPWCGARGWPPSSPCTLWPCADHA